MHELAVCQALIEQVESIALARHACEVIETVLKNLPN